MRPLCMSVMKWLISSPAIAFPVAVFLSTFSTLLLARSALLALNTAMLPCRKRFGHYELQQLPA